MKAKSNKDNTVVRKMISRIQKLKNIQGVSFENLKFVSLPAKQEVIEI